jgi:HAD superfamily hydrolase (TIGR01549 family)
MGNGECGTASPIARCLYDCCMTTPVRALLFDLGDTLWHYPVVMPLEVQQMRCAEQIGPLVRGWGWTGDRRDLSGRILNAVERAFGESAAGSLLGPDFIDVLDSVVRGAGLPLDADQLDALWSACQVDGARVGRQLYPDTLTTLTWARDEGYRLGLIVNRWHGAALAQRELESCGLGRMFDSVTVSSDTGWLKPHPEIFYAALGALGSAPDETVMVGDSIRDDIGGAKRIGMRAVWKRNGRRHVRPSDAVMPPDAAIDDLWELRRLSWLAVGSVSG